MDLRPSPEQAELAAAFAALYAKHSSPDQVRAAEPLGFDEELWQRLVETGVVSMAVDEAHGGWGASLLDLALVAEQHGRHVGPAPVIEAQVAARVLARSGAAVAAPALDAALAGERLTTIAVRPARRGRAELVPAAAVADDVLVLDGRRLVLVPLDARPAPVENLGSAPLADVDVASDAAAVAEGAEAVALFERAIDEWLVLTANALVGIAARGLEIGVEYVKERKAWGVPIGSFQAISHRLADSAAAVDGARLLAYEAAWAEAEAPARAAELAAMAFAFACETARDSTYRSLHFHGGYGFMMEYDIQLYYRRARGWPGVLAEPDVAYLRAGDRRYGAVGG